MKVHVMGFVNSVLIGVVCLLSGAAVAAQEGQAGEARDQVKVDGTTYIYVGSAISYNASLNRVSGVSVTYMDYATWNYYDAYVQSTLSRQGLPVGSGTNISNAFINFARVDTQATGASNTDYSIQASHRLYPIYFDNYGEYCPDPNFRWIDPYGYFGVNGMYPCGISPYGIIYCELHANYGAEAFVFPRNTTMCLSSYAYPGNTDNFLQTPTFSLSITNSRVQGNLAGTNQYTLVGAYLNLTAAINPAGLGGGSYSWSFSGVPVQVFNGVTNNDIVVFRPSQAGNLTAMATYSFSGGQVTAQVNISSILPTLTQFTASVEPERVDHNLGCSRITGDPNTDSWTHTLGCYQGPGCSPAGIILTARATIPDHNYLSDPSESGIKMRQFASIFRKQVTDVGNGNPAYGEFPGNGNFRCATARLSQTNVDSGWQLDGEAMDEALCNAPRFGEGNILHTTVNYTTFDGPGSTLLVTRNHVSYMADVSYSEDEFDTFVDYFVGIVAGFPSYVQTLKLVTENDGMAYSHMRWRWNGQAIFIWDPSVAGKYILQLSNSTQSVTSSGTNSLPPWHGDAGDTLFGQCTGDPSPSLNRIDGARFFVSQQYADFAFVPDQSGLDFWTSEIATCAFGRNCIYGSRSAGANHGKRTDVAQAFFNAAPFNQKDPAMAHPPGTPGFDPAVYNPAFVQHCYLSFLQRMPEPGGFAYWLNNVNTYGDYLGVIDAFVTCDEYRNRFGPITPRPW